MAFACTVIGSIASLSEISLSGTAVIATRSLVCECRGTVAGLVNEKSALLLSVSTGRPSLMLRVITQALFVPELRPVVSKPVGWVTPDAVQPQASTTVALAGGGAA